MQETTQRINLNWSAVEKALAEGTFSGYKIGILETEKVFDGFLAAKKIPGLTIDAKIKYVADFLSRAEQLRYARQMYKKILEQPHFEISREETKQVVSAYWQAMLDLEEALQTLSAWQKMNLRLRYFYAQVIRKIKIIGAALAGFILFILFFNDTILGKKIIINIGKSVHFLAFTAGPWILGTVAAAVLLWLGMKVLGKKRPEF
ncbi:MAG: hypothetical protein V1845_00190 [bacterium]